MPGSNAILKGLLLLAVGAAVADVPVNTNDVDLVNVNEVDALKLQGPFGLKNPLSALKKVGENIGRVEVKRVPGALFAAPVVGAGKVGGWLSGASWRQEAERQATRARQAQNARDARSARNYDHNTAELWHLEALASRSAFAYQNKDWLRRKIVDDRKSAGQAEFDLKWEMGLMTPVQAGMYSSSVTGRSRWGSVSGSGSGRGSPAPSLSSWSPASSRTASPSNSRPVSPGQSDAGTVPPTTFRDLASIAGTRLRGASPSPARPVARSAGIASVSGSSAWSNMSTSQQYPRDAPRARGSSVPGTANLASSISNYGPLASHGRREYERTHGYGYGDH